MEPSLLLNGGVEECARDGANHYNDRCFHPSQPDFIVRLKTGDHLIVETKGSDELATIKAEAAARWVAAVNADGQFGGWRYAMARSVPAVREILDPLLVRTQMHG